MFCIQDEINLNKSLLDAVSFSQTEENILLPPIVKETLKLDFTFSPGQRDRSSQEAPIAVIIRYAFEVLNTTALFAGHNPQQWLERTPRAWLSVQSHHKPMGVEAEESDRGDRHSEGQTSERAFKKQATHYIRMSWVGIHKH